MKKYSGISILLFILLLTFPAFADFPVYQGSAKDYGSDVVYNSNDDEYLVVWLNSYSSQMKRLLAMRVDHLGQTGTVFTISDYAEGLPSVAYNPQKNEYLVVFVSGIAPDLSIYGQRLSATGSKIGGTTLLIPNANTPTVLYNSKSTNYLVVGGKRDSSYTSGGYDIRLYSRKIDPAGQPINTIQTISEFHTNQLYDFTYSIAYAPVVSSETPFGRYLMALDDPGHLKMLDSDGQLMVTMTNPQSGATWDAIPFQQSKIGASEGFDLAFGYWNNEPVFLVVWADKDKNMTWQSLQWTGIWCGIVDAVKIDYLTTDGVSTETFPISKIWAHWAYSTYAKTWNPVVDYNDAANKFMVAWRETPGPEPQNDTNVNHIRGNAKGSDDLISSVPDNVILSAVTGSEDPFNPAIAVSSKEPKALVVWEDKRNFNTQDFDIYGNILNTMVPSSENTQVGTNIQVDLGNGSGITFGNVVTSGNTKMTTSTTGTPPPNGFTITPAANPVYYTITTTAAFTGTIEICIHYDDTGMTQAQEAALKLQVYENPPGAWKDITTSLNTGTNIICGTVNHLSEFAVMFSSDVPDIAVNPNAIADSVAGGASAVESFTISNSGNADLTFDISGAKWEKMPGSARDIGVGDDGE
ncbi:MAG: hypothetical protein GXO76_05440, partial [Calditrichaeota bacterium]|nr:hypothetical protein [Calditrichota bacterium]